MTSRVPMGRKPRVAVILSGGGARGAYEVGVLWYVFDELTRLLGAAPRIDILCGTSVGAISACYLAAHLGDPVLGMQPARLGADLAHQGAGQAVADRPADVVEAVEPQGGDQAR